MIDGTGPIGEQCCRWLVSGLESVVCGWRREWDLNSISPCRFCRLRIPQCHGCRECPRCRSTLPAIARRCRRPLHAVARTDEFRPRGVRIAARARRAAPPARRPVSAPLREEIREGRSAATARWRSSGWPTSPATAAAPIEMDSGERAGARPRRAAARRVAVRCRRISRAQRVEVDIPDADKICACGHAEDAHRRGGVREAGVRAGQLSSCSKPRGSSTHVRSVTTASSKPPRRRKPSRKSLAGEGLLAHVVVSKYVDHLPLYRLEGIFRAAGRRLVAHDDVRVGRGRRHRARADRRRSCGARSPPRTICRRTTRPSRCSPSAAGATRGGSGPISIRSRGRSSSMRPRRMNATDPTAFLADFRGQAAGGRVSRL